MPWSQVVEILKLGLIGLVFLLAVLGFRLLSQEQRKDKPDPRILSSIRFFLWFTLGSAALVGAFTIVQLVVGRGGGRAACHDSFGRLVAESTLSGATAEQLRSAIRIHAEACGPIVENWQ